jgi:hypothetical protein
LYNFYLLHSLYDNIVSDNLQNIMTVRIAGEYILDKIEGTLVIEEELENLREKLNDYAIKYIEQGRKEGNENLIAISRKLDNIIVAYIKSSN